ncbi:helix-turn-helix transcriptional regulator [Sphingobacterium mizutaii]|uniref:helix-turn-helix transcriptional regulator n=1 Tax=Sphingobacterium mizutaii TaxID=1010 RepID=UPI0028B03677|nr:AraC family transcriptional regulator [Sphingobacterium mizutaii]
MDKLQSVTLKEFYGKEHLKDLLSSPANFQIANGFSSKQLSNEFVEGKLLKYHEDAISITYQEWDLSKPFKLRVRHASHLIKVQFEIEGNSHFESHDNYCIIIPSNHYQFINIPNPDGHITYSSSRKVLDIYMEQEFLFQLLRTQGYSDQQLKAHFLLNNYTFCRQATPITAQQQQLIQELLNHQYQSDFAKQFIRIKAIELMITVFVGASNQINQVKWIQSDIDTMMSIKEFLDKNYHQDLRIKSLSRQFGINEFKLKNGFKDLFGDTVFGYIRRQKMKKAKELLRNPELEIKEIAYLIGFKYAHHFSKVYLDHYQIRPSEYRNKHMVAEGG